MDHQKSSEIFNENDNGFSECENSMEEYDDQNTEETPKELFNGHLKMESYYKAQVDDFLKSASPSEIVVVLINFSAIGVSELQGQLVPGEMALTAFSVQNGVIDNCSIFINHGNKISERVSSSLNNLLKLPPSLETEGEDNFKGCIRILNSFRKKCRFGNGMNQHALLFCRKSDYDRVTSCLDFLFEMRGGDEYGYQIFPLEYLLTRLVCDIYTKNDFSINHSYEVEATEILEADDHKHFFDQLACAHHFKSGEGLRICPLRIVKVHAYNIIGSLVEPSMAIVGIHWPTVLEDEEIRKQHEQLLVWSTESQSQASVLIPENYEPERNQRMTFCIDTDKFPDSDVFPDSSLPQPSQSPDSNVKELITPPDSTAKESIALPGSTVKESIALPDSTVKESIGLPGSSVKESTAFPDPGPRNTTSLLDSSSLAASIPAPDFSRLDNVISPPNLDMPLNAPNICPLVWTAVAAPVFRPGVFLIPELTPLQILLLQMPTMQSIAYLNPSQYHIRCYPFMSYNGNNLEQTIIAGGQLLQNPMDSTSGKKNPQM